MAEILINRFDDVIRVNRSSVKFVSTSNGVLVTFLTDLFLVFVCFLFSCIFCRPLLPIFQKKEISIKKRWSQFRKRRGKFERIVQWFFRNEKEYKEFSNFYGKTAGFFLFFEKVMILIFLVLSLFSLSILFPLYLTGDVPVNKMFNTTNVWTHGTYQYSKEDNWLVRLTVSMIVDSYWKQFFVVGLAYFYVFVVFLCLFCFTNSKFIKWIDNPHSDISNYSVHVKGLPETKVDEKEIEDGLNKRLNNTVYSIRVHKLTEKMNNLQEKLKKNKEYLFYFETVLVKERVWNLTYCLSCICDIFSSRDSSMKPSCCSFDKKKAVKYYKNEIRETKNEIDELSKIIPTSSGEGHIIFNTVREKKKFGTPKYGKTITLDFEEKEKLKLKIVGNAHEPADIVWENFSNNKFLLGFRTICIHIVMIIYALFFTSPFYFVSSVLAFVQQYSVPIIGTVHVLGDYFLQYFPTLCLYIFAGMIPHIIYYLTKFEKFKYRSSVIRKNAERTFAYLVITTVILPTCTLTSIDGFLIYLQNPKNVSQILRNMFLPTSGAFFVNYLIHYSMISICLSVLNLADISRYFFHRIFAITDIEKNLAKTVTFFYVDFEIGYDLSIITLLLTYSIFSPVIVVIGVVYFIMRYFVNRINIIYVYHKNPNNFLNVKLDKVSYEKNIKWIFNLMFLNVFVFVFFTLLFFIKLSISRDIFYVHMALILFLLMLTCIYALIWNIFYKVKVKLYEDKSVDDETTEEEDLSVTKKLITKKNLENNFSKKELREFYRPPFSLENFKDYPMKSKVSDDDVFSMQFENDGKELEVEKEVNIVVDKVVN